MTGDRSDHKIREEDVSRLPFTAGVVLAISAVLSLILGWYTVGHWRAWLFIGLGAVVAATSAMLLFRLRGAAALALIAAVASLVISAIWVSFYFWFGISTILLDALAIFAIVRSKARLFAGKDPQRT